MRVVSGQQSEVLLVVFYTQEEMTVITGGAASSGPETLGDKLVFLHRGGEEEVGSLVDAGLEGLPHTDLGRGGNNLLQTFLPKPCPAGRTLGCDQGDALRSATLLSCRPWARELAGGGGGQVQGSFTWTQAGQTVAVLTLQHTVSTLQHHCRGREGTLTLCRTATRALSEKQRETQTLWDSRDTLL